MAAFCTIFAETRLVSKIMPACVKRFVERYLTFGRYLSFDLRQFQAEPASLGDALRNRPSDNFSVSGR
jgi:hypothetical protein